MELKRNNRLISGETVLLSLNELKLRKKRGHRIAVTKTPLFNLLYIFAFIFSCI